MKKVKITAMRRTEYPDLIKQYENPIEHACDVKIGDSWVSENAQKPAVESGRVDKPRGNLC